MALAALNAKIHSELAYRPQPFLGLCHVRGGALGQTVRLLIRLVCNCLVALFHRPGIILMGVDLPLVGGDIGLDFLPIIRGQRFAVRPFAVPAHGLVVLDGLNGPHLLPGGIVVGNAGVQIPGPLC